MVLKTFGSQPQCKANESHRSHMHTHCRSMCTHLSGTYMLRGCITRARPPPLPLCPPRAFPTVFRWTHRPRWSPSPLVTCISTQEHLLSTHSRGQLKLHSFSKHLLSAGLVPASGGGGGRCVETIRCGPPLAWPPGQCRTQPGKQIGTKEVPG